MIIELYIDYLEKEKGIKPATLTGECFSRQYVENWILRMKEKRAWSNSTCNHHLACLRAFLKYLVSKDVSFLKYLVETGGIPAMKCQKKSVEEITKDAIKALFAVPVKTMIGLRDLAFLTLMYSTATRVNEVLSLQISSLRVDGNGRSHVIVWGKGNKRRTIYLLPKVNDLLKKYINVFHGDMANPNCYLFYSQYGGQKKKLSQEAMAKRLKMYAAKAAESCSDVPLNLHCHSLRHAKASHWLEEGLNIVMIQKLLGHEDISTTMMYVGVSTEQKAKALETLEDDTTRSISKKWKGIKKTDSLAHFLGLN